MTGVTGRPSGPSHLTTTEGTIVRGPVRHGGWRDLEAGPPEPYQHEIPSGEVIACLWHLSDVHLCDAESPARVEYLDRYSDPDSAYRDELGDIGTYRPQEGLTVQVATSMVEAVNRVSTGPTTGVAIEAVLLTGDLTDNAQRNELALIRELDARRFLGGCLKIALRRRVVRTFVEIAYIPLRHGAELALGGRRSGLRGSGWRKYGRERGFKGHKSPLGKVSAARGITAPLPKKCAPHRQLAGARPRLPPRRA